MAEVAKLNINGTSYQIKDETARGLITEETISRTEQIANLASLVGSPLVASTKSAMNNTSKIYVYTGTESGMTNGNWYYYNGSAWTSGGVYTASNVNTDKTLSVSNVPADAQTTGNEIKDIKNTVIKVEYTNSILTHNGYLANNVINDTDSSTYWKYSDMISLGGSIKSVLFRGVGLNVSNVKVQNIVFYDADSKIITSCIDNITSPSNDGRAYSKIYSVPVFARYMRVCTGNDGENFKIAVINDPNIVVTEENKTYSTCICKNAIANMDTENGYLNPANGNFVSVANSGWRTSDFISCKYFNVARFCLRSTNAASIIVLYDENENMINALTPAGGSYTVMQGEIDISTASKIRCCFFSSSGVYSDMYCDLYTRYDGGDTNKIIYHSVNKPYAFSGKTAVFCGDSITRGFTSGTTTTENGFPKLFSNYVNMSFTNKGVGGASLARVSGYSCIQDQITSISNLSSVNFIFIAGGINDWQLGVSLYDFREALSTICSYLKSNYSGEVIFILPINEAGWSPVDTPVASINAYREVINEVALSNEYAVVNGGLFEFPTISSNSSFINEMFGDLLHPTEKGYRLYTKALKTALL